MTKPRDNMHCNFFGEDGDLLSKVLPPLLITEFILGILGNGLALWIFCFHVKPWKSSTVFLFNLALADFLLNIALPFRVDYYMSEMVWNSGEVLCRISLFLLAMNRSGSILFLMGVAFDRYMHVVHPHHPFNFLSVSKAICFAAGLWIVTISMTAHLLASQVTTNHTTECESFKIYLPSNAHLDWHQFVFLFSFYLPLIVILYCTVSIINHLRGRQLAQHAKVKRSLYLMIFVVILFIICFLPSNITQLIILFKTRQNHALDASVFCESMKQTNRAFYITITMTYLNSMLDPAVYYFSSPTFKNVCRTCLGLGQAEGSEDTREKKSRETVSQPRSQL